MNYLQARNMVLQRVGGPSNARLQLEIVNAIRARQLSAAVMNHRGWSFLLREGYARNDGGYDTGTLAITKDARTATLTGGTWPTEAVGWHLSLTDSETEVYTVAAISGADVTLDRPYEGTTVTEDKFIVWDPYAICPRDLSAWRSLRMERYGKIVGYEDMAYMDAIWPKEITLADGVTAVTLAERTASARYETGTVGLSAADATVTLSGGTWPLWCVNRHLRFQNEMVLYKIASRTSDTVVELDRNYGGDLPGTGISYELDPPGAIRLEVRPPQEDQFAFKIRYFAEPQALVNDTDLLEGPEAYQSALIDLVAVDVLYTALPQSPATEAQQRQYQAIMGKIQMYGLRGQGTLEALMGGNVVPEEEAVLRNVKYR